MRDLTDPSEGASGRRAGPSRALHPLRLVRVPGDYLQSPVNDAHVGSASLELARALATHGCGRLVGLGTCFEYELEPAALSEDGPLCPVDPVCAEQARDVPALESMSARHGR